MRCTSILGSLALALLAPGAGLLAQSASSTTFFLVDGEFGPGGTAQSFVHALTGISAAGAPAARALSPGFVLLGGFPAAIETPAGGRPWLSGVTPAYAPLLGGTPLVLHGTELHLGAAPAITVGGVAAPAGPRTQATFQTTLPAQPEPGYRAVTVQTSAGSSTLPQGLGVLPLLDLPVAHQANVPFALRYLGAQGDQVVLIVALGRLPFTFPLPPFHHGLQLDLATMIVLPALVVTNPLGTLLVDLPAVAPPVPIWFQALTLTQNAGWFPGSFTNVTRI